MIFRYAVSIVVGTVVTIGLLFLMQSLIASADRSLNEDAAPTFVDFVRVEREQATERKERKPEKPPEPAPPPPTAPQPRTDNINPDAATISIDGPGVGADMNIGIGFDATSDGDYLPVVKVQPVYPRRALSRGLEGYVLVEFTVTTAGTVKDVVVVESDPPNIFDRAAMQAALKFKYKPRVVDGNPIEVAGVRNLITFELED